MGETAMLAATLGLGALSSGTNYKAQQETNKLQYQMFQEGNAFAAEEAQKAFDRQSQFAWDMFNAENAYNTPSAQMQRLMDAGLSPWDYFGKGNALSSAQGANVGSPSAAAVGVPGLRAPSLDVNMIASVDALSKIIGAFSNKNLSDAQSKSILAQIEPTINNINSQTQRNQVESGVRSLEGFIQKLKFSSEMRKLTSEYLLNIARANESDANTNLKEIETMLGKLHGERYELETPIFLKNLEETGKLLRSQQITETSKQAANYASAEESRSHAGLMNEQRETQEYITNITSFEAEFKQLDYAQKTKFVKDNWERILTQMRRALDTSSMTEWRKYEVEKRLKRFYERLNNQNDDSKLNNIIDDCFMFFNHEVGINFGAKLGE